MAVVHLKSTQITNATATPLVKVNATHDGGMVRATVGTLANSAADDIGSTYRFVRVPSNCRVHRVWLNAAATGVTGQYDVGIYQTAENGGAVVDADFFASAVDPGGGAINADITHESGQYSLAEAIMPLWQALGLSSDPGRDYDVVATATEALADAVQHTLKVEYVL